MMKNNYAIQRIVATLVILAMFCNFILIENSFAGNSKIKSNALRQIATGVEVLDNEFLKESAALKGASAGILKKFAKPSVLNTLFIALSLMPLFVSCAPSSRVSIPPFPSHNRLIESNQNSQIQVPYSDLLLAFNKPLKYSEGVSYLQDLWKHSEKHWLHSLLMVNEGFEFILDAFGDNGLLIDYDQYSNMQYAILKKVAKAYLQKKQDVVLEDFQIELTFFNTVKKYRVICNETGKEYIIPHDMVQIINYITGADGGGYEINDVMLTDSLEIQIMEIFNLKEELYRSLERKAYYESLPLSVDKDNQYCNAFGITSFHEAIEKEKNLQKKLRQKIIIKDIIMRYGLSKKDIKIMPCDEPKILTVVLHNNNLCEANLPILGKPMAIRYSLDTLLPVDVKKESNNLITKFELTISALNASYYSQEWQNLYYKCPKTFSKSLELMNSLMRQDKIWLARKLTEFDRGISSSDIKKAEFYIDKQGRPLIRVELYDGYIDVYSSDTTEFIVNVKEVLSKHYVKLGLAYSQRSKQLANIMKLLKDLCESQIQAKFYMEVNTMQPKVQNAISYILRISDFRNAYISEYLSQMSLREEIIRETVKLQYGFSDADISNVVLDVEKRLIRVYTLTGKSYLYDLYGLNFLGVEASGFESNELQQNLPISNLYLNNTIQFEISSAA
ncbi:MAG: hypothetical protein ABIB11_00480 [Candidatus Omnitrophota bacterium]